MKLTSLIVCLLLIQLVSSQTTTLGPDTEPGITDATTIVGEVTGDPVTGPTTTEEIPTTFPSTDPSTTNPPVTNPPVTNPPVTNPPTTIRPTTPAPACTQNGLFCSDPYSISLCYSNEIIITNKCPSSSPYCNKNACSKVPSNPADLIPFRCTSEGYFPDPSDCAQYKFCPSAGAQASAIQSYTCPQGYIFDVTQLRCVLGWLFSYRCQLVVCGANNRNQFIEYKPSKGYYAFCSVDGEATMFKCPDALSTEFNPKTLQCEFKCPWEGYFKSKSDCTKYYFCHWVGLKLQSSLLSCPSGYYFNGLRCLKGHC